MTADVRGKVLRTISGNIERSTRFYNWGALMRDLGWPQAGPWRQGVDRHELSLSALMERNAALQFRSRPIETPRSADELPQASLR